MEWIGYIIISMIVVGGLVKLGKDFNQRLFNYLENHLSVNLKPAPVEKKEVQVLDTERKELNS